MKDRVRSVATPWVGAVGVLLVGVLALGGCAMGRIPVEINEVDESKYELEFLRCEVEPIEDTEADLAGNPFDNPTPLTIVAEFEITNRDDIRRRFDIRATLRDSADVSEELNPHDTNRLDPGESSVEQIRTPAVDGDVPPYSCSAEVWDSLLDTAFPDD